MIEFVLRFKIPSLFNKKHTAKRSGRQVSNNISGQYIFLDGAASKALPFAFNSSESQSEQKIVLCIIKIFFCVGEQQKTSERKNKITGRSAIISEHASGRVSNYV